MLTLPVICRVNSGARHATFVFAMRSILPLIFLSFCAASPAFAMTPPDCAGGVARRIKGERKIVPRRKIIRPLCDRVPPQGELAPVGVIARGGEPAQTQGHGDAGYQSIAGL